MEDVAEQPANATDEPVKRGRKPKTTANLRIRSMNGRNATGGVNVAPGILGKIKPGDVCEVPIEVAGLFDGSEFAEVTKEAANCRLVGNEVVR